MTARALAKGLLTFVPGVRNLLPHGRTGGTDSAEYSFRVWLAHLGAMNRVGLRGLPNSLAEIGPGDSLGVGLAAMLSGVDHFRALDVVRYSSVQRNVKILDDLLLLFRQFASSGLNGKIPEFAGSSPSSRFPWSIISEASLASSLAQDRVRTIRDMLTGSARSSDRISIDYVVPWFDVRVLPKSSIDAVVSHAVLEHVADLEQTYLALHEWLKPGGFMSHQIDFGSHGLSEKWNGFREFSELRWLLTVGKRDFLINRIPLSMHKLLIEKAGFEIRATDMQVRTDGISRANLSRRWKMISDEDFYCAGAFIQAMKPARQAD